MDVRDALKGAVFNSARDLLNLRYFQGCQRVKLLGLSSPPELKHLQTIANIPRSFINAIIERQDVRSLRRFGAEKADPWLLDVYRASGLARELALFRQDKLVFGRAFLAVSANPDDNDFPLIDAISPLQMHVKIDYARRQIVRAVRFSRFEMQEFVTIWEPNATIYAVREKSAWREVRRDEHNLGRVPIVMDLNRQMSGVWAGETEMVDVIPLTDGMARSLTNMDVAQETLAVPARAAAGISKGDFVDIDGKPLPIWEAYYGAIWATENKDAKFHQFAAADLGNFHETVRLYGSLLSAVTGLPPRYFGLFTTNPPAENTIKGEESRLIRLVERKNSEEGIALGWALGIAERLATGEWPRGNRILVDYHDPATPTFSQKADALQKLAGGVPIISRQGAWDELGWSEARKDQEREYFREESSEGFLGLLEAKEGLINESSTGDTI